MSSRNEALLEALLNGETPNIVPQSRMEALLLALCQQGQQGTGGAEPMTKIFEYTVEDGEALNGINIALTGKGYKEVYVWCRNFTITKDGEEVTAASTTRVGSTRPVTNTGLNLAPDLGNSSGASQGTNIGAREFMYYGKLLVNGSIWSVFSSSVLGQCTHAIQRPYPDAFTEFRDLRFSCTSGHYYAPGTEIEVYAR